MKRKLARVFGGPDVARRQAFQDVYAYGQWGHEEGAEFFSGVGSRGKALEDYAEKMGDILVRHRNELGRPLTIVDLGCGDFAVGAALMSRIPDSVYVGCDIVPEVVARNNKRFGKDLRHFLTVDIVRGPLPKGDVCLIRQVLQHLPNSDIRATLALLNYDAVYVTEGHPEKRSGPVNPDKPAGHDVRFDWESGTGRGVELSLPPFDVEAVEMFRTTTPPHEVIVTERIFPKRVS